MIPICFSGNLTGDPELRFTQTGTAVLSMHVAVNHRTKNEAGEWVDGEPSFYRVSAFRQLAEHAAESLSKGDRVVVGGKLKQSVYEVEGEKRRSWEVNADDIGASLLFGGRSRGGVEVSTPAASGPDEAPF